ncbi:sulfotransferase [Novosphingobium sp.]|uniref:tetratricopeptide repeat-containing sulfotransferase family protein n=1 Tax=Novosphingobium sp. TaxID=1874826 RepID=UPI0025E400DF|nr:sulfotransferase [Novosphingobium sp.]
MIDPALAHAAAEAEAALAAGHADGYDCMVAALGRNARGDTTSAETLFTRARDLAPDDPAVLTGFAQFLRQQGRLRDAVEICDAAIRAEPTYADAWIERGTILSGGGSDRAASESFAHALSLAPHAAVAHAGLAALASKTGDADVVREHARAALAIDAANVVSAAALARIEIEAGQPGVALDLLRPMVVRLREPSNDRSLAWSLIGDAHDKLGECDKAFAAYARSKADFGAANAVPTQTIMRHSAFVRAITAGLEAMPTVRWPEDRGGAVAGEANVHVFLFGYPRSGTTLVENVLASLPGVAALEERPTLATADTAVLAGDAASIVDRMAAFARADEAEIAPWRQAYWTKVAESGVPPGAPGFVDMDPLKGTRLPLIARLFPGARLLRMMRDPRDVVWSCFRTHFAVTSNTLDFTTLEDTARHYDALMRLTALAEQRLPIVLHEVRYDCLVRNFDTETRAMCAAIGLPWNAAMRRFDRTANARGVATASVGQVRKGLYDGTRQWERYAEQLAPVMPILAPWIERFDY